MHHCGTVAMRARLETHVRDPGSVIEAGSKKANGPRLHLNAGLSPRRPLAFPSPPVARRVLGKGGEGRLLSKSVQSPKMAGRRLLAGDKINLPVVPATPAQTQQQELLKKTIKQYFNTSRQAFDTFDRKKHGVITRNDFMHALDVVGLKICEEDRKVLRRSIDKRNTKMISYLVSRLTFLICC